MSTKIGLTPHSLHHRGEKPRDTYPPPALPPPRSSLDEERKDDWSLAENVGDALLRAISPAVAALPSDRNPYLGSSENFPDDLSMRVEKSLDVDYVDYRLIREVKRKCSN